MITTSIFVLISLAISSIITTTYIFKLIKKQR